MALDPNHVPNWRLVQHEEGDVWYHYHSELEIWAPGACWGIGTIRETAVDSYRLVKMGPASWEVTAGPFGSLDAAVMYVAMNLGDFQ
jgi:hypothetical protein